MAFSVRLNSPAPVVVTAMIAAIFPDNREKPPLKLWIPPWAAASPAAIREPNPWAALPDASIWSFSVRICASKAATLRC